MLKTHPAIKTFIVVVYTRCILVQKLLNTAGQHGYMPPSHNMYNVFAKEDDTVTMDTTMMDIATLTMGSTITGVQTATIPDSVANAINQLSANQTALMNQMVTMSYANVPPPPPTLQYQQPIRQLTIPVQHHFAVATMGGFNPGNGGGGRGGRSRQGWGSLGGWRNQHTLFANYGRTQGVGSIGQGRGGRRFIPQAPGAFTPQAPTVVPPNA